jgi:NAD(P)-dependent dehydrogenase (short-subunit alcohol dehydrogenase family)
MTTDFSGKTVIVTGAAKGIGQAAAVTFARKGATLVLVDLDAAMLDEVAISLRAEGATVDTVAGDCGDEAVVRAYVAAAVSHGGVDALFCNAGIRGRISSITTYERSAFDEIVRANLRSVFLGLRLCLPEMVARKTGSVVVTCSNSALTGLTSMPGYVATKTGALGLVRAAAADVAQYGVRVNALLPGATYTPMLNDLFTLSNPADPSASARRYAATMPTGRLIEPEEQVAMALYLCSDEARFVNGAYFLVDAGRTISASTTTAGMREAVPSTVGDILSPSSTEEAGLDRGKQDDHGKDA